MSNVKWQTSKMSDMSTMFQMSTISSNISGRQKHNWGPSGFTLLLFHPRLQTSGLGIFQCWGFWDLGIGGSKILGFGYVDKTKYSPILVVAIFACRRRFLQKSTVLIFWVPLEISSFFENQQRRGISTEAGFTTFQFVMFDMDPLGGKTVCSIFMVSTEANIVFAISVTRAMQVLA